MPGTVSPRRPRHAPAESNEVCAICGTRHAPTYNFGRTLAVYGIEGKKAAMECVRNLHRTHRPVVRGHK